MPTFGTPHHPYGGRAVADAISHHTANVIASVTFDQRGLVLATGVHLAYLAGDYRSLESCAHFRSSTWSKRLAWPARCG
ncbi:MAG: hypothetical protein ACR2KG_01545 [Nocardioidaceae bacterium]